VTAALARQVHERLLADDDRGPVDARRVAELAREAAPLLSAASLRAVVAEVMAEVSGLGVLEPLMTDPTVSEVMVNGPDRVWVERNGRLERVDIGIDAAAIERVIEKVVAPLGLRIDRSSPLVDARLPDGSRVNAVIPPLAIDGPCLTVRRFAAAALPLDAFCPPGLAAFLRWAVRSRLNLVVSGGTGAGKTTLLNALAAEIGGAERVITVEDAAELRLVQDHVVRLESRPPNAEGVGAVRVRDLVRNALRMRPDRIVVGEVRGPEALDMLQAMNTGHEGSLSTCHANAPLDALRRIETMVLMGDVALPLDAVREQIAGALDLVVQVERGADGVRHITAVSEVEPVRSSGDPVTVRALADADGLRAMPERPPRTNRHAPDPTWISA
jgi:pilus assembly protein CpaF